MVRLEQASRPETTNKNSREFVPLNPPLTTEQMKARETWMQEEANWRGDHSVPSEGKHYRYMWNWDSKKAIVINARRGDPDRAALELRTLESYRDPTTGFLSNKIFATQAHKTWRDYPEAWNFNNNKVGTSYTQPPIEAWSVMETYNSFVRQERLVEGIQLLKEMYGTATPGHYTGLQGEYAYFINHRQNSATDPLLGIVHPNEDGRDSDEAHKPWLAIRNAKGDDPSVIGEWVQMQKLGWKLGRLGRDPEGKRIDWIPEQVREKYWVNDVMFNAMYVSNLRYMADIAGKLTETADTLQERIRYEEDRFHYKTLAQAVETQILERMWNPEKGFFYNLDKEGNQIPVDSITGLFPLLLDTISKEQTTTLLDKLDDPDWFNTPYPIPTHAVHSPFFDEDPKSLKGKLTPPWSGKVWISTNQILVEEGLVKQAERFLQSGNAEDQALGMRCLEKARHIAQKTKELLATNEKVWECYSPTTGEGSRVQTFMWSNIGLHFEKTDALVAQYES